MFISRVEVPWEAVRNPYDVHRLLWRFFPGEARETRTGSEQERQGFLFRIEDQHIGRPTRLLVQSRRAPVCVHDMALLGTREFNPVICAERRLAFVLTANPVKNVIDIERIAKPNKKSKRCRVPIVKEEGQIAWLGHKLTAAAELEHVTVLPHAPLYFKKHKHAGKLVACTFEGTMRVLDAERLVGLLENGVGPAKAFGCGLLLVRRA